MSVVIELPFAALSQNEWQRMHWGRQAKFKESVQLMIRMKLAQKGVVPSAPPDHRMRLTIRRYSSGRLDRGNFIGGCKPLLDALRDEWVIRDDNERWLEDRYEQLAAKKGEGRTEIEIAADGAPK